MLADRLGRRIAFGTRGAGVPGHHIALGVEHEDGVIDHRLHQHLVMSLGQVAG